MTDFGATFKKARDSRGISLDQIARETRISTRFLAAIENEEFHLLPGGVFNRGFIRTFAEKVGLDPDQAVLDYQRLADVPESRESAGISSEGRAKDGWSYYPVAIGALALLIAVFYIVTRETSTTSQTAPPPTPPVLSQPATPPPQATPVPEPPSTPPKTAAAAPELETAPSSEPLRIDLEAQSPTWMKATADGSVVNAGEILQPGMTRHFTAKNFVDLVVGNAGGVNIKINGMPGRPLGKGGQVRELKITVENFRDFIS